MREIRHSKTLIEKFWFQLGNLKRMTNIQVKKREREKKTETETETETEKKAKQGIRPKQTTNISWTMCSSQFEWSQKFESRWLRSWCDFEIECSSNVFFFLPRFYWCWSVCKVKDKMNCFDFNHFFFFHQI